MTVAELIALLQTLPPDDRVWAEGCDCINPVRDVDASATDLDGETIVLIEVNV